MNKARVILDKDYIIARTDPKLFSSFVEPLGRCIYGGLYEPGHPTADEHGIRQDVMRYVRPLRLTANRFPGGNYTSTFRWEDSIGPKEKRPHRAEVAWQCIETNEFGLNEFADWSRAIRISIADDRQPGHARRARSHGLRGILQHGKGHLLV